VVGRVKSFKLLIAKVADGASLTRAEALTAFDAILSGEVTPAQIGGFLLALRVRRKPLRKSPVQSPPCAPKCCGSLRRKAR
jgi:hypothetical protein